MTSYPNVAGFLLDGKDLDAPALQTQDEVYCYRDLLSASLEFGSRLLEAGARPGDRVAVIGANSLHWVAAYLGCFQAEMVCVPLPVNMSPHDLDYILASAQVRFAYLQHGHQSSVGAQLRAAGVVVFSESKSPSVSYFSAPLLSASIDDLGNAFSPEVEGLAAVMFTSGSTGQPRGVMVTHSNIIANATSIIASLDLRSDQRMMTVLPFHYCFGTSLLHTYLHAGATLVLESSFTYPERVLDSMQRSQCTSFAGVPSHYQILLRNSSFRSRALPHIQSLLQAGGHLSSAFIAELQMSVPHARIFIMYGQTEATARLACLPPEQLTAKRGSVGKAIPGVELRVLNDAGEEVGPGEVGEIVAKGGNVAAGYWRDPEETKLSFRSGCLYTGDLATIDDDGFIYIVDRAKEFVKCGGTRVSCRQLEDCLLQCGELLEAAVVPIPDEILGEAIRAFITIRPNTPDGLTERLLQFCRRRLPYALIPKEVVILPELPKNESGKVKRSLLRSMRFSSAPVNQSEAAASLG